MLQLEEARERILAALRPLPAERVPLADAVGRILAEDLAAPLDLPMFDNSAMDGYAVRADDLKLANDGNPVRLRVASQIPAGTQEIAPVAAGSCARIFTGSPLPPGADVVVMQEDVGREGDLAIFREPVKPWENIRFRGEDVKAGTSVLSAGDQVSAGAVALLGALGIGQVAAHRRPLVGLLATGDELREAGALLAPGQIYESNRAALAGLVRDAGGVARLFPLVPDTLAATRAALTASLSEMDIVITSGGVSVGELDFVKDAFRELGGQLDFWRVAIRPGKPFVFGSVNGKLLFGLPGNPVSAFVTALLLVRPALLRIQGAREVELPGEMATAAETFSNKTDRRHFMRVRVDANGVASLTGLQASHALMSLAKANGLVDVAPGQVIERGAPVRVLRFAC